MASAPVRRRGLEDDVAAQITFLRARAADVHGFIAGGDMRGLRVGVGVHRDGADAQSPRGARDAAGDLAAVRDQQLGEHGSYFFGAQEGARFSRNAAMPSRPSGDTRASAMHFAVAASSTSSMGASTTSASRRLVAAKRRGARGQQVMRDAFDFAIETIHQRDFVHEAQRTRLRCGEFFAREHVTRGLARAHGAHQVRRDGGRHDAELHFRQRKVCGFGGDHDVAGSREAHPATEGIALHATDHRPRAGMHGSETCAPP